jgi:GMP synthase-like glutamine amidotransferase
VRILHVEHPDGGGPGVFGECAQFERWRAWLEPPPDGDADAIVLCGGENNPGDIETAPWLRSELAWLRERLADGVPALGICLGGQLIAAALDAPVTRCDPPEIGWSEVEVTGAGREDPVLSVLPARFMACQWHSWQFAVPQGGELLARSDACAQAFRHGRAWALQFHAEVDGRTLTRWNEDAPDPARAQRDLAARLPGWNVLGRRVFDAFLAYSTRASAG